MSQPNNRLSIGTKGVVISHSRYRNRRGVTVNPDGKDKWYFKLESDDPDNTITLRLRHDEIKPDIVR